MATKTNPRDHSAVRAALAEAEALAADAERILSRWGTVFSRARDALKEHGVEHHAIGHPNHIHLAEMIRADLKSLHEVIEG